MLGHCIPNICVSIHFQIRLLLFPLQLEQIWGLELFWCITHVGQFCFPQILLLPQAPHFQFMDTTSSICYYLFTSIGEGIRIYHRKSYDKNVSPRVCKRAKSSELLLSCSIPKSWAMYHSPRLIIRPSILRVVVRLSNTVGS